jgi:two-component system chemotaxis response regulator CheY
MGLSILVVDDYVENTEMMSHMLHILGHQCTSAHDGKSALALLRDARFDLLITDDRMGTMSGFDLAAAVRADSSLPQLPILLISAYEYEPDELSRRMAASGIDAFLPRPWTPEKLRSTIESLAKRSTDV